MPALPRTEAGPPYRLQAGSKIQAITTHQTHKEEKVNIHLANWTDAQRAELMQTVADKLATEIQSDPDFLSRMDALIELSGIPYRGGGDYVANQQQLITLMALTAVSYELGGEGDEE